MLSKHEPLLPELGVQQGGTMAWGLMAKGVGLPAMGA